MAFTTLCKSFDALTPHELYAILRLRNDIFVVEQNCVFQDADNKDQACDHLMLFQDELLVAYARLVPAGHTFAEMSIGRIVTSAKVRGTGAGKQLMKLSIENCRRLFGSGPIRIGAQLYVKNFYESFGFIVAGEVYDEDGIPHVEMILPD